MKMKTFSQFSFFSHREARDQNQQWTSVSRPGSFLFYCSVSGSSTKQVLEGWPLCALCHPAVDPRCGNSSIWRRVLPHRETTSSYIELCLEHMDRCTIKQQVAMYRRQKTSFKSSHGSFSFPYPSLPPHGIHLGLKVPHLHSDTLQTV